MKYGILLTSIFMIFLLNSCENSSSPDNDDNEIKISTFSSDDSHNAGNDCMTCHKSGGSGEGWFSAAGTVYDSSASKTLAGGTIKLYTQSNGKGELVKTIQVDRKGNFYTTESIDFSKELYPVVISANNDIKYMAQSITSGACNLCHNGVATKKIWTK